ncbi:MAG: tRNA (adenosine(37)-N6)-threonylcarbamoyltransferase complex ATPase subunit type 1 TsaE [Candidatus Omnitrophota bacterium]
MELISQSVRDTLSIGKRIAKYLKAGDILCLFGELGSGKTVLTKGIAEGLGIHKEKVTSPSFVLIREHRQARLPLYHFDLYRLKRPKDILALGLDEYLYADGVTVIEWANRLGPFLPDGYLKVGLFVKDGSMRRLRFSSRGSRAKELMGKIR